MLGFGVLKGRKTYITAAMTIIGTVASYLVGEVQLADAAQLVLTAILGITIRAGVKADTAPVEDEK